MLFLFANISINQNCVFELKPSSNCIQKHHKILSPELYNDQTLLYIIISDLATNYKPIIAERTNEHIDVHFVTCFTALVLIRLLQAKLDNSFPVGQIINVLKSYNCIPIDANTYQFTYYDEILEKTGKVFDMDLDNKYRTRQQIQRFLRY